MNRRILAATLLCGTSLLIYSSERSPSSEHPSGLIGLELKDALKSSPTLDPHVPIKTYSGRSILPGTIDADGYKLPLDVIWSDGSESPVQPASTRPNVAATAARRGGPFVETRLGLDDNHTQNETSIDADGAVIIAGWNAFTAASTLDLGVGVSTDGGATWSSDLIGGHSITSDPTVKSNGAGRWFYGYLASPGPGGSDIDIYVRFSDDDGGTWSAPVVASLDGSFDDKPYIDAVGSDVLVGFADFGQSPAVITATNSTNNGVSYGNQTNLVVNAPGGNGACPVIAPDGTYHMFWRGSFQEFLWVATSEDQGATWSDDRTVAPMDPLASTQPGGYRLVNLPSADANPITGHLVVVWNDEAMGDGDILSVTSSDGGLTWTNPVKVNDDSSGEVQFFPWIDIDDNGIAHVVWYDRRENGFDIDVYMSTSTDNGATWGANVRISEAPFVPVLPTEGGAASFIGDYNGIAATTTTVYPFYQDSRRGEQDVYVARVPTSSVGVPQITPPSITNLVASPTPFADHTVFRAEFVTATGGETMQIVSVDGRVVRTLTFDGPTAAWDGRDDAGTEVAAGVYLGTVPGQSGATRVVKLK